jgi:hypothetical protein
VAFKVTIESVYNPPNAEEMTGFTIKTTDVNNKDIDTQNAPITIQVT